MLSCFQFRELFPVAAQKKDSSSARPIVLAKSIISLLISEARILEDAGFSVLEATSSDGAISYLESRSDIRLGAPCLPKSPLLQTIFVPRPYDILELMRRRKEV